MKWYYIFFVSFVLLIASCTVEEFDDSTTVNVEIEDPKIVITNSLVSRSRPSSHNMGLELGCFVITYPFELITSDSAIFVINSNNDFISLENQVNNEIVDFKYPITIVNTLGLLYIVPNLLGLAEHFSGCFPDSVTYIDNNIFPAYFISPSNSCYDFKYPIVLSDSQGQTYIAQSENEFIVLLTEKELFFHFPFTLISQENVNVNINTVDGLLNAIFDCNELLFQDSLFSYDYIDCYKIIYPVNIRILGSDTVYRVNNSSIMEQIFEQGKFIDFVYPLNIESFDGQQWVIIDENALELALLDCQNIFPELIVLYSLTQPNNPCFDIVFPIQSIAPDGQVDTYQNLTQIENIIDNNPTIILYTLVYPLDVILKKDGVRRTLKNKNDLFELQKECD